MKEVRLQREVLVKPMALGQDAGRRSVKVDPAPGVLSARIVPPCASAIQRQMERPSPTPPFGAPPRLVDAVEPIEDAFQVLRSDPDARVAHPEQGRSVLLAPTSGHLAAFRGVLQRVIEQVEQEVKEQVLVAAQRNLARAIEADGNVSLR